MPRRWLVKRFGSWWRMANKVRPTTPRSNRGAWECSIRYRQTALKFAQMVADVSP